MSNQYLLQLEFYIDPIKFATLIWNILVNNLSLDLRLVDSISKIFYSTKQFEDHFLYDHIKYDELILPKFLSNN